jgi:hypothetical protein
MLPRDQQPDHSCNVLWLCWTFAPTTTLCQKATSHQRGVRVSSFEPGGFFARVRSDVESSRRVDEFAEVIRGQGRRYEWTARVRSAFYVHVRRVDWLTIGVCAAGLFGTAAPIRTPSTPGPERAELPA